MVPDAQKYFLAAVVDLELEIFVPHGRLSGLILDFGLELPAFEGERDVGAHLAHRLSVSCQLGLDHFDVQQTLVEFHLRYNNNNVVSGFILKQNEPIIS